MKNTDSKKLDQIITMLGDIVDVFGKRFDKIDARFDKLDGEVAAVKGKVDGTNRRLDTEAMQRTDLRLPRRVHELRGRNIRPRPLEASEARAAMSYAITTFSCSIHSNA